MSFFEPPPPPAEPDEPEGFLEPEWMGPPDNELGTPVPLRLVLARTDNVALALADVAVYSNGFALTLLMRRRSYDRYEEEPLDFDFHYTMHRRRRSADIPPEVLRFGVEFADGSKATNLEDAWMFHDPGDSAPEGPVMVQRGGGGGGGRFDFGWWVWPLPPEGPLAFVCEWPAQEIGLTRHEIDAGVILEAASHVERLWDEPGGRSGGTVEFRID